MHAYNAMLLCYQCMSRFSRLLEDSKSGKDVKFIWSRSSPCHGRTELCFLYVNFLGTIICQFVSVFYSFTLGEERSLHTRKSSEKFFQFKCIGITIRPKVLKLPLFIQFRYLVVQCDSALNNTSAWTAPNRCLFYTNLGNKYEIVNHEFKEY